MLCCTSSREPAMHVCPVAAKMPEIDALHRVVDLRIVEDDVRRLATELHRDVLHAARGSFVDALAGRVGPGEGDLRHERMLDQRRADVRRRSR